MGRRGDEDFAEFAAGHELRMRRIAFLMCGDWQHAADIVQEALIRLYVAWPRLERKGGLAAYARKAVVSAAIDMRRRRSSTELPTETDDSAPDGVDVAGAVTDRQTLLAALGRLPERQRACVVLRYYEDLAVGEVARLLGCSAGTVKSQTSRALGTLQTIFKEQAREDLVASGGARSW